MTPPRFCRVIQDYDIAYPKPIRLKKGDEVKITKREVKAEWLGWVFCTREDGTEGWVSETYLEMSGDRARVIKDYDATELRVVLGEIVEQKFHEFGWAWVCNRQLQEGWVPLSHLAPSLYPPVRIRLAAAGDEGEIANVHLNAWREAYKGLLPADFLDHLPLTYKRRCRSWKSMISQPENFVTLVAEAPEGIVGFASLRQGADPEWQDTAELGALYLLQKYHGGGVGFNLLSAGFRIMQERGFERGFCWVLEGNPTAKFYERTGARPTGEFKSDLIGGQACRDLRYEWRSIVFNDYDWQPISIADVTVTLRQLRSDWAFAGGWAIDLFVGQQTREHSDTDILIAREHQSRLHDALPGWELWVADPPAALRPWAKGEYLGEGIQDIWCRKVGSRSWKFQFMLFDLESGQWVFKRDRSIRRPLEELFSKDENGAPFLVPEVQLLYKAKSLRRKDQQDFENALLRMNSEQRAWLGEKLTIVNPSHPWLESLRK